MTQIPIYLVHQIPRLGEFLDFLPALKTLRILDLFLDFRVHLF